MSGVASHIIASHRTASHRIAWRGVRGSGVAFVTVLHAAWAASLVKRGQSCRPPRKCLPLLRVVCLAVVVVTCRVLCYRSRDLGRKVQEGHIGEALTSKLSTVSPYAE